MKEFIKDEIWMYMSDYLVFDSKHSHIIEKVDSEATESYSEVSQWREIPNAVPQRVDVQVLRVAIDRI